MSDENKPKIEGLPTINMVYVGYRFINGKQYHLWHRVESKSDERINLRDNSRSWLLSKSKNLVSAAPGMVYSFPTKDDGQTVYNSHAVFIGRWHDKTAVQQWQAEHQAHRLAHTEAGKAAKAQKENLALDALLPFREAYAKLDHSKRALMLAWLIRYITHQ